MNDHTRHDRRWSPTVGAVSAGSRLPARLRHRRSLVVPPSVAPDLTGGGRT